MPPAKKDNTNATVDATGLELRRVRNRELELKRITGEISCAECRRLKLKCDKKVPCSSCVRRGCKQVCPTGTSVGSSGRQIAISSPPSLISVSNGNDATRKLTAMSERIRALEDALHIQTNRSHPLLSAELLAIKQGIDVVGSASEDTIDDDARDDLSGAFGTLSVSEGKTMRFLGASATDSVLLAEALEPESLPSRLDFSLLPIELAQASRMWPFTPAYLSGPEHIAQLILQLPPYERVTSLTEAYFTNLAWFMAPIDRAQVVEDLIPIFYPRRHHISPEHVKNDMLHDLALLFAVFACGAVADLTQPAVNPEAERYHQLARAALGMRSFMDYGSFSACQALFLMGSYEVYSGRKTSQESSWKVMTIAMSLASSIGLHREPSRWNLDAKTVNWRRRTFWEINTTDKWKSLASGRPMSFSPEVYDCEFPLDRGATLDDDGTVIESVWQWRYRYTRDVLALLTQKLCAARPPRYSDLKEMDRLVRDFNVHPFVQKRTTSYAFATDGEYRALHPYITLWWKEMSLLYIHRNCFARAMLEYPNDPVRSPFGPSFLAAYKSATTILQIVSDASDYMPLILERLWPLWATALSCGVIVGSVACRASSVGFAGSALHELEKALVVFERASKHPVARSGVTRLTHLRDKAVAAFQAHESRLSSASLNVTGSDERSPNQLQVSRTSHSPADVNDNDEDLNILRGTTRFVEQRSIPSDRELEGSRTQIYLTYDVSPSPSISSTGSPGVVRAPASSATAPLGGACSPNSSSNRSTGSSIFQTMNKDSMFSPSPLVQNPPNRTSPNGDNGSRGTTAPPTTWSRMLDQSSSYDSCPRVVHVPAWATEVGHERAPAGSEQFEGHQQHPAQPGQTQNHDSISNSSFSTPQGSVPTNFPVNSPYVGMDGSGTPAVSQGFDPFATNDAQPFLPFDFALDSAGAANPFFSGPAADGGHSLDDLDELYQKADGISAEAWQSFMQQFEAANAADKGYRNWEAMSFAS